MIQFQTCKPVFWVGWDCRKGTFQPKISPAQQISVQNILSTVSFLWEATELKPGFGQNSSTYISESGTYKWVQHCKSWPDKLPVITQGISPCTAHELRLIRSNRSALAPMALPRLCHPCLLDQRWSLKVKASPLLWTETYLRSRSDVLFSWCCYRRMGVGK